MIPFLGDDTASKTFSSSEGIHTISDFFYDIVRVWILTALGSPLFFTEVVIKTTLVVCENLR